MTSSVLQDPVTELLERAPEMAALLERIEALHETVGGRCLLVSGEAGVGKTSFLRAVRARTAGSVRWLWGACDPFLTPPPLSPLIDLIDQLPISLAAAVRQGRAGPELLNGLLATLKDSVRPVVLVIDDIQWADDVTLDLIRYLARRIDTTRALLVLTARAEALAGAPQLRALFGSLPPAATWRIRLQALSAQAVTELAQRAGRSDSGLFAATQGNPFFVSELLAATPGRLPPAVCDAVLARVAQLCGAARDLLEMACVSPTGLEIEVADAVLDDTALAIDECVEAGLLERHDATLRFRHELARQALISACSARRLVQLHAALFDALSLRQASTARLVHHAAHACLPGAVQRFAPIAAREAAQAGAHRQAAALYELALDHGASLPQATRAEYLSAYAASSSAIQRIDDALRARQQALELHRVLGDSCATGRDLREIARMNWLAGAIDDGLSHAREAIDVLEASGDARELAMALATMAQLCLRSESVRSAIEWGRRALRSFEALGDVEGQAYALNTIGFAELIEGGKAASWQLVQRSLALSLEHDLAEHVSRAYVNLASLSLMRRRFADLHHYCALGLAYAEAHDQEMYVAGFLIRNAGGQLARGELNRARSQLARLVAMPQTTPCEAEQSQYLLALIDLRQGCPDADGYWSDMIESRRKLRVDPWFAPQAPACAEAAWLAGRPDDVERIVRAAWPAALRNGESWCIGQLACWLRRIGRTHAPIDVPIAGPFALELAGDLCAAAQAWAALACPYEQALVLLQGDVAQVRYGLSLLEAMQAEPAARIARRRLRALGVRLGSRGPYRAKREDPLGLTRREREVLDLLAEGLSNTAMAARLCRSPRTVENHVAALLAKLSVDSREQAAARARSAVQI